MRTLKKGVERRQRRTEKKRSRERKREEGLRWGHGKTRSRKARRGQPCGRQQGKVFQEGRNGQQGQVTLNRVRMKSDLWVWAHV